MKKSYARELADKIDNSHIQEMLNNAKVGIKTDKK